MAYLEDQHSHKRLAGVAGVALIHVVLAAGIAAGLTVKAFIAPPEPTFEGEQITYIPPPPPDVPQPPETPTQPQTTPPTAPSTPIDLTNTGSTILEIDLSSLPPIELHFRRAPVEIGPPLVEPPAYVPTSPVPSNGPSGWVSNNDYPRRALTRGWEGDVFYALDVGADGSVDNCRILNSSGRRILDDTACRMIESRAEFEPATDNSGANVSGTYRGTVSWIIPED